MVRLRNFIVHVYDAMNLDRIWQTCIDDIPPLITYLDPLLPFPNDDDK